MTFSVRVKEEVSKTDCNRIEALMELTSFIKYAGHIYKDKIVLTFENGSIARRIYKDIKSVFNVDIHLVVRNQKRFRKKQIYIFTIYDRIEEILESLSLDNYNKNNLIDETYLSSDEEKKAYLKGTFLACGSLSDPSSSYHFEFSTFKRKDALFIKELLNYYDIKSKIIKRENKYITYIKSAEAISDIIKLLGAMNSFFYFEDIRIYRDHKNMVNRLNNCEIANQEKSLKTGLKQIEDINYVMDNDLTGLLDENIRVTMSYRLKYPDSSLQELANIISVETGNKIGKSGINHHFIKIRNLIKKHINREKN